ncbi:hypothetical protein [Planotetraspora sp. GP83]|uniref:divisome protein SepX/GlpR n=1 Tax=Planotetraspora sp. GP83 TaxID=3156264 RepID=UPI003515D859
MGSALLYLAIVVMWLSVLLPMWLRRDRHVHDDLYDDQPAEADTVVDGPPEDRSNAAPEEQSPASSPAPITLGASATGSVARSPSGIDSPSGMGSAAGGALGAGEGNPATADAGGDGAPAAAKGESAAPARPRRTQARRRAAIVARRRRRLLWSILLLLASVVTAAVRVMPWWGVTPSGVLLVTYIAVLRVAVRVDSEQREKAARARAEHLRRARQRRRALAAMAREAEIIQFEARKRTQVFDQYADGRRAVGD